MEKVQLLADKIDVIVLELRSAVNVWTRSKTADDIIGCDKQGRASTWSKIVPVIKQCVTESITLSQQDALIPIFNVQKIVRWLSGDGDANKMRQARSAAKSAFGSGWSTKDKQGHPNATLWNRYLVLSEEQRQAVVSYAVTSLRDKLVNRKQIKFDDIDTLVTDTRTRWLAGDRSDATCAKSMAAIQSLTGMRKSEVLDRKITIEQVESEFIGTDSNRVPYSADYPLFKQSETKKAHAPGSWVIKPVFRMSVDEIKQWRTELLPPTENGLRSALGELKTHDFRKIYAHTAIQRLINERGNAIDQNVLVGCILGHSELKPNTTQHYMSIHLQFSTENIVSSAFAEIRHLKRRLELLETEAVAKKAKPSE